MRHSSLAFTLVELIVVITILAILGTIGYISLLGYQVVARDTVRISDINIITKAIELYKLEEGSFPVVSDFVNVTFSGSNIWRQGTFGKESQRQVRRVSEIPKDPLTGTEYAYSTTYNTSEYQVGAIVERASSLSQSDTFLLTGISRTSAVQSILPSFATSKINGNYNGVFITHTVQVSPTQTDVYILGVPTILASDVADTELSSLVSGSRFAVEGKGNAPASYSGTIDIKSPWTYTPVVQNDINNGNTPFPTGVIYKTTLDEFNTGSGKLAVFTALKDYYSTTDLPEGNISKQLTRIDPSTQPNTAIDAINKMIGAEIGGLGYIGARVNEVDTSSEVSVDTGGSGGDSGEGTSSTVDPTDPVCLFDETNFGECNFG